MHRYFYKLNRYRFIIFAFIMTAVKLILMGLFSSDYQNLMFMPFVSQFINGLKIGQYNVYNYYYDNNLLSSFPYPPLMLLIESFGGFISMQFDSVFARNLFFKLPLFFADLLCLFYLIKIFPKKKKYIGFLYYASPIIMYSVFMHGQLDIITTAIFVVAIYYLTLKSINVTLVSLLLSVSLLTKFHIIAVLPLCIWYIYQKHGIRLALIAGLITSASVCGVIFPFWGPGFIHTVLLNKEQQVIYSIFLSYFDTKLYFTVFTVVLIYLVIFTKTYLNKELLMSFCAILFSVFLALCPPMPGWYVWIVPFLTIVYITSSTDRYKYLAIYFFINMIYLIYFIFFHKTDFIDLYFLGTSLDLLKTGTPVLKGIVFTILSASLVYCVFLIYKVCIQSDSFYKISQKPFSIAIAGDSGSGKSSLVRLVDFALGKKNVLFIEGDGDHRWERGEQIWEEYTHLNPKANYLYKQALDIRNLKNGLPVDRVDYDHSSGKFTNAKQIRPRKFIVLCGLHSLYLPQLRKSFDLKIYMDIDEKLRRFWKIKRDTNNRGYSKSDIQEQIEARVPDAEKYIYPQKDFANFIIRYFDKNLDDYLIDDYSETISLAIILSSGIDIEAIVEKLVASGVDVSYDFSDDLSRQIIEFDGKSLDSVKIDFDLIAGETIPFFDDLVKGKLYLENNLDGIILLFLLAAISHRMKEAV